MKIEAAIQRALVVWIKETYPQLSIHASLNENSRHQMDMGCDAGITDLLLFHRRGVTLHILFLELKTKKGKLKPSQMEWEDKYYKTLRSQNTWHTVAYGFEQAKDKINQWMLNTPALPPGM